VFSEVFLFTSKQYTAPGEPPVAPQGTVVGP
jgi:hypothetical protein